MTAAHCVCTHFQCTKDEVTGEMRSDYDPGKDIKIFVGELCTTGALLFNCGPQLLH